MELSDYLSTCVLSKNTTSIIIGYLTDPPALPFITELLLKTDDLNYILNHYYYYQNKFIRFGVNMDKTNRRSCIRQFKDEYGWRMRITSSTPKMMTLLK